MTTSESAACEAPNFDRLAGLYRWMEAFSFGPFLWRCRTIFLPELAHCHRALILGDGDGRFTARLLHENAAITVLAVDASPAMLTSLHRRCAVDASRLNTQLADLRAWLPPAAPPADLVVTHFFLDCLTTDEVQTLAAKLEPVLAPSALWLVSEFAIPSGVCGRLFARPLVALLYWVFGCLTGLRIRKLPNYAAALAAGFSLCRCSTLLGGLLRSELWVKMR